MEHTGAQEFIPNAGQKVMQALSKYHASKGDIDSELKLIEAAKADPAMFAPLYDKYYEQIFRYIYARLDDKDLSHDATQQVFLKALSSLQKYQYRGVPYASFLYRIAKSEVYQALRDNQKQRAVNIDDVHLKDMIDEMEENIYEPHFDKLAGAIAGLEEADLQIVQMRFFEKRAFKEIGEILEITENNAKVKLYRVLDKLKKKLESRK